MDFFANNFMQQLLKEGGPIAYVLLGFLVIATMIFLERFFYCHRATIDTSELLRGLFNVIRNHKRTEAMALCDNTPGPVSRVIRAAVSHADQSEGAIRQSVEETALSEIPRLERHIKLLACLGRVAPIMGLLGTFLSLMNIFKKMEEEGHFVEALQLAPDIRTALITTALGLLVALLVELAYFILSEKIDKIIQEMEKGSNEMISFLLSLRMEKSGEETEVVEPEVDEKS